jgi:hypothetical protein
MTTKLWSVFVVTLTDALVDTIKLAMLDIASEMKPGITDCYSTSRHGFYGCTFVAKVTLNSSDGKEAFAKVEKALAAREIQYLSLGVTELNGGIIAYGNIIQETAKPDSVYRMPPAAT